MGATTSSSSAALAPEPLTLEFTRETSLSGNERATSIRTALAPATARAPTLRRSVPHRGGAAGPPSGPIAARSQRATSTRDASTKGVHGPLPSAIDPTVHTRSRGPGGGRHPSRGAPSSTFPVASSPAPGQPRVSSSLTSSPRLAASARTSRRARQSPVARSRALPGSHAARASHPSTLASDVTPQARAAIAGDTHAPRTMRKSLRQPPLATALGPPRPQPAAALASAISAARIRPQHTPPA